jgi:hypothetical protein
MSINEIAARRTFLAGLDEIEEQLFAAVREG